MTNVDYNVKYRSSEGKRIVFDITPKEGYVSGWPWPVTGELQLKDLKIIIKELQKSGKLVKTKR